jgi:hypothetical protein
MHHAPHACPIPTQTEKQPKTKNKLDPTPEHGMGKHRANPSQQRKKTGPEGNGSCYNPCPPSCNNKQNNDLLLKLGLAAFYREGGLAEQQTTDRATTLHAKPELPAKKPQVACNVEQT